MLIAMYSLYKILRYIGNVFVKYSYNLNSIVLTVFNMLEPAAQKLSLKPRSTFL